VAQSNEQSQLFKAFLVTTYAGIVFNISATIGAIVCIDILGELPLNSWKLSKDGVPKPDPSMSGSALLKSAGADFRWTFASFHFFVSFVIGSLCTAIQIGLLAWIQLESPALRGIIMLFLVWGSLPLFVYLLGSFMLGLLAA
jgi:hypothetical protein